MICEFLSGINLGIRFDEIVLIRIEILVFHELRFSKYMNVLNLGVILEDS